MMPGAAGAPPHDLSLQGVGKTFGTRPDRATIALRGVDLSVSAGEIVVIVGVSGCGKSTLLRIVAGLEPEFEGRVAVSGAAVEGPGPDRGMVFQEHRLLPWLTVAENVAFGLASVARAERRKVVGEQLALVGLSAFENAYPHQLSGGMAQRAALARALAPRPSVLLLDEPFAALDAFTKVRLQEQLVRTWEALHPTLIIVTHDIEEAIFLADRVVVMSDRPGTIREVLSVGLPRPRDRTSAAFVERRRAVLRHFDDSSGTRALIAARPEVPFFASAEKVFAVAPLPKEAP